MKTYGEYGGIAQRFLWPRN